MKKVTRIELTKNWGVNPVDGDIHEIELMFNDNSTCNRVVSYRLYLKYATVLQSSTNWKWMYSIDQVSSIMDIYSNLNGTATKKVYIRL